MISVVVSSWDDVKFVSLSRLMVLFGVFSYEIVSQINKLCCNIQTSGTCIDVNSYQQLPF